jgi:siroheme synthase
MSQSVRDPDPEIMRQAIALDAATTPTLVELLRAESAAQTVKELVARSVQHSPPGAQRAQPALPKASTEVTDLSTLAKPHIHVPIPNHTIRKEQT